MEQIHIYVYIIMQMISRFPLIIPINLREHNAYYTNKFTHTELCMLNITDINVK